MSIYYRYINRFNIGMNILFKGMPKYILIYFNYV